MSAAEAGRRFKSGAHACLLTGLVRCAESTQRVAVARSAYGRSLGMAENPLNKISGMCIECT
ncbi:hypothetical protein MYA_5007 [Burkholderia sp. KJ006]|nr:hypothetical protein MYA_5007 [Burkholderia sp. KJ006]